MSTTVISHSEDLNMSRHCSQPILFLKLTKRERERERKTRIIDFGWNNRKWHDLLKALREINKCMYMGGGRGVINEYYLSYIGSYLSLLVMLHHYVTLPVDSEELYKDKTPLLFQHIDGQKRYIYVYTVQFPWNICNLVHNYLLVPGRNS